MNAVTELPIETRNRPAAAATPDLTNEKIREHLLDALKTALTQPGEHRLFCSGRLTGLFPSKHGDSGEAAKQALAAGLIEHVRTESRGQFLFEWVKATPRTAGYVAEHDSPKAILRELRGLLGETKNGVPVWMEQARNELRTLSNQFESRATAILSQLNSLTSRIDDAIRRAELAQATTVGDSGVPWAEFVLRQLDLRAESGVAECPLSELFAIVTNEVRELSIPQFHDGLRRLAEAHALHLKPGADEPEFAMLHNHRLCQLATRKTSTV